MLTLSLFIKMGGGGGGGPKKKKKMGKKSGKI